MLVARCSLLAARWLASSPGFHKQVALDAGFLALHRGASNWVSGLCHALSLVGYNLQLNTADMQDIDIRDLRGCLPAQLAHAWESVALNPRSCPSEGARLCTYLRWFACPTHNQIELLRLPLPYKTMVKFLRFRTGCHALPNVTRGWEGVPRSQRLCPLCQSQYCDERHALLECPALVSLREKYHQLFCVHNSMRQFLWQNNMILLVRYVIKCLDSFAATQ